MPRIPIPTSTYTFPNGKPILLLVTPVLFVVAFLALAVRWVWIHGHLGWDGVSLLVAMVVAFGVVDHGLLRFYERQGRAHRAERNLP
jgi:hypothetical protein